MQQIHDASGKWDAAVKKGTKEMMETHDVIGCTTEMACVRTKGYSSK